MQNITVLGVDAFILISGFYGIRPKLKSIVNLFTLLFFFYVGCYLWDCGIGHETFSYVGLFGNMMAFSRTNWFISGYLFLMLLAPMINAFVDAVNLKSLGLYILLYCAITLYLGYYQGNEYWYYNEAYSVTMMVGVYLVGRYLHRVLDRIEQIKYWHIAIAFVGVIGIMSIIRIFSSNEESWLHYGSPITISAAVLLFLLFYKMPKFQSKFVNWAATSCLASFILHTCDPVFSWFVRKDVMYFTNDHNLYLLTSVVGKYENPLHEEIVGHFCLLDSFAVGKFGWFKVELADGYHRICTSVVKALNAQEDLSSIVVTTANSVYTFTAVTEETPVTMGVESHAER